MSSVPGATPRRLQRFWSYTLATHDNWRVTQADERVADFMQMRQGLH
jgi:hypothetical protein